MHRSVHITIYEVVLVDYCCSCLQRGGLTNERIDKLLKVGANVILTTKGIDDMTLKYFVQVGAIAVRRVRKEDMRHVAKTTGATLLSNCPSAGHYG
ncbi:T-complex protein 1 subunit alpha [Dionaea muscipula]